MAKSKKLILDTVNGMGPDALLGPQVELVIELLEHEAQHHGQLIRFFYANDIPFPGNFAKRYAL